MAEAKAPQTDKRKQSLYFPERMLTEIQYEANRQDRSLSWIVQKAWQIARSEIGKYPSVNDLILNTCGGAMGIWAAFLAARLAGARSEAAVDQTD